MVTPTIFTSKIGHSFEVEVEAMPATSFSLEKNLYPISLLKDLSKLKEQGIFLCGGSALALFLGHSINTIKDYDFYCKDANTQKYFEQYLITNQGMVKTHVTDNALTFAPRSGSIKSKVQIIIRNFYPDYQAVFADFDFSICKVGYMGDYNYCFGPTARQHILEKKLVLEGKATSDFFKRWFKYDLKGFKMPREQVADILKTVQNINFDARLDMGY